MRFQVGDLVKMECLDLLKENGIVLRCQLARVVGYYNREDGCMVETCQRPHFVNEGDQRRFTRGPKGNRLYLSDRYLRPLHTPQAEKG